MNPKLRHFALFGAGYLYKLTLDSAKSISSSAPMTGDVALQLLSLIVCAAITAVLGICILIWLVSTWDAEGGGK